MKILSIIGALLKMAIAIAALGVAAAAVFRLVTGRFPWNKEQPLEEEFEIE